MLIFTTWSQWAHGNLRNWAEDHELDSMAEERPKRIPRRKKTEMLERSEVWQGELSITYLAYGNIELALHCLEIYGCSKPLSVDSLISNYTAWYLETPLWEFLLLPLSMKMGKPSIHRFSMSILIAPQRDSQNILTMLKIVWDIQTSFKLIK